MNKTQKKIMDEIEKHGYFGVSYGYTSGGTSRSWGHRNFNAAIALRDAGLVKFENESHYTNCGRRNTDHCNEFLVVANKTDEGNKL